MSPAVNRTPVRSPWRAGSRTTAVTRWPRRRDQVEADAVVERAGGGVGGDHAQVDRVDALSAQGVQERVQQPSAVPSPLPARQQVDVQVGGVGGEFGQQHPLRVVQQPDHLLGGRARRPGGLGVAAGQPGYPDAPEVRDEALGVRGAEDVSHGPARAVVQHEGEVRVEVAVRIGEEGRHEVRVGVEGPGIAAEVRGADADVGDGVPVGGAVGPDHGARVGEGHVPILIFWERSHKGFGPTGAGWTVAEGTGFGRPGPGRARLGVRDAPGSGCGSRWFPHVRPELTQSTISRIGSRAGLLRLSRAKVALCVVTGRTGSSPRPNLHTGHTRWLG